MIAAGITLIAAVFLGCIAATVKVMGWKLAAGVWAVAAVGTAVLVTGAWLLESGLTQ